MSELRECRCPICKMLLCKSRGTVEVYCRGGKNRHEKTSITFSDGKPIKQELVQ